MNQRIPDAVWLALVLAAMWALPGGAPAWAVDAVPPDTFVRPDGPPLGEGHYVTSLCSDLRGRLWVGTEDRGVWRQDATAATAKQWRNFTRENTGGKPEPQGPVLGPPPEDAQCLGDDSGYALVCDRLGRIWVGHLNHGVSVFNGEQWQNYDVLSGPLGERVFGIAVCPTDGDVWITTNAGLTRYSLSGDNWRHYTTVDGLVSDHVQALAFDPRDGTLYVATQCDGLAVATRDAKGDYGAWRTVKGPAVPATVALGQGLPTNLLNCVLVTADGTGYGTREPRRPDQDSAQVAVGWYTAQEEGPPQLSAQDTNAWLGQGSRTKAASWFPFSQTEGDYYWDTEIPPEADSVYILIVYTDTLSHTDADRFEGDPPVEQVWHGDLPVVIASWEGGINDETNEWSFEKVGNEVFEPQSPPPGLEGLIQDVSNARNTVLNKTGYWLFSRPECLDDLDSDDRYDHTLVQQRINYAVSAHLIKAAHDTGYDMEGP